MKNRHRNIVRIVLVLVIAGAVVLYRHGRSIWAPMAIRVRGQRTVADVQEKYGLAARERLRPHFEEAGIAQNPARVALLVFKAEERLDLWAADADDWKHIKDYPVLAASGTPGPKLREGDRQVPEGMYRIEYLNPNSSYHLSMKLNYPNEFDLRKADEDGRKNPGSDIFIHGKSVSIGCIAVGDSGIEELFDLVSRVGGENVHVLIAPNDLRQAGPVTDMKVAPSWLEEVYANLKAELAQFPCDPKASQ